MEGYEVVLSGGDPNPSSTTASSGTRTLESRKAAREAALLKYPSYLTVADVVAASKGVGEIVRRINPTLDNTWRNPNASFYKCTHNCPKGSLGKLPGTSAYGQRLNGHYGNMDHPEREDYIQSCMVVSQGGQPCVSPDNKICKMKLYCCDKTCPFTRFEKQVLTSDNKEIEVGYKNPILFKNDTSAADMNLVRADHAMGDWYAFWSAVKQFRKNGTVENPPDTKGCRAKILNFNQFRNLCAFNCMLNYQYDEETQSEVKCEINDYINMNIGLYQDAIRFLQARGVHNEGNPWLYAYRYDQFAENVVSRDTMMYAALYKFEKSMVADVGARIVMKFCQAFAVNNNKVLPDIPPKSASGKRAKPDSSLVPTYIPMMGGMPGAAGMLPAASGFADPTATARAQNFWEARYPDPSPSGSVESSRKKAQATLVTTGPKQAPTFVRQKQQPTALPAGDYTRPGTLQYVPRDNNMSTEHPIFFGMPPPPTALAGAAQGSAFVGPTQGGLFAGPAQGGLFAGAGQQSAFAGPAQGGLFAGAAQGSAFAGAAQGVLSTREKLERERAVYTTSLQSGKNMIGELDRNIQKLSARAGSHQKCVEMFRELQAQANTNGDTESANKYGMQLANSMNEIQADKRERDEMLKKHAEQSRMNDALTMKYQTSVAVYNQQMASLPPPDVPTGERAASNRAGKEASTNNYLLPPGMAPNSIDSLIYASSYVFNQ